MFRNKAVLSSRATKAAGLALALGLTLAFGGITSAQADTAGGGAPVDMGSSAVFAVLGSSTVTNAGPTSVTGELGVASGTAVTGFPPGEMHAGTVHNGDDQAMQAQTDLSAAYADAASRVPTAEIPAELGGTTLTPGVYSSASLSLTGTVTLSGGPTSVFIFQAGSTLITASGSNVVLTGGVRAANVFWLVGSSATLATHSSLVGTVLAYSSVAAQTGSQINGRLMASNGAVTMDTSTVTVTH